MEQKAPTKAPRGGSQGNLFLFAAGGIGIYVLLKILDPAIAYPLRHISSSVATFLLNALSIPVTREGTAISTSDFTFDVDPDCSGSTSLRIMLTLGALWFGMYPNLTLGRRLLCLLFAAPIAVFCNALRVTALVVLGDKIGKPVEGLPHELIGILAFALAMAIVYLMTLLMAKEPTVRERSGPRAHLVIFGLALLVCYAPVLWGIWTLAPEPIVGIAHLAFVTVGLGMLILAGWGRPGARPVPSWIPCMAFVAALAVLAVGTLTDVITLSSLSLAGAVFAIGLYFRGWEFAMKSVPILGILFLGLPGMHLFKFVALASRIVSESRRYHGALLIEAIVVGGLVVLFLLLGRRGGGEPQRERVQDATLLTAIPMKILIFITFGGVLFQNFFNSQAADFDRLNRLDVPLVLGDWTGTDLEVSANEIAVIGRDRLISRLYTGEGGGQVHLLVSSTGADRRRAHKPEYCMTVRGWEVEERDVARLDTPDRSVPMTKLLLGREGNTMEMRYWFDDGEGTTYGTFAELYPADVARRAIGRRTDWQVYRVFGTPGSPTIDEFLKALTR